jgi:Protein of unknown function (DUF2851)
MKTQEKNSTPHQTQNHPKTSYKQESQFQHAWGNMRFDRKNLCTTQQQPLRIHHPGKLNTNQGPDFLDAEIQIGQQRHHGHVELHLEADDWTRHRHHLDPHYNAVVLHVYLQGGRKPAMRLDGSEIPELYLGDRIATSTGTIRGPQLPCMGLGHLHLPDHPAQWLEDAGQNRLQEKARKMQQALVENHYDWSQLLWEELAAALGGPINGPNFRELARQVPWSLARRYCYSSETLESLLFGSCGMLDVRMLDPYQAKLQEQWHFFQSKHGLLPRPIPLKFHRMHPAGFPTVRIAQLASLACSYRPIIQLLELAEIRRLLQGDNSPTSEYWAYRYEFGHTLNMRRSELGAEAKNRIVVNVLAPLAQLYAHTHAQCPQDQLLTDLLRDMPAENNKITRKFQAIGLTPSNALQSQGILGIHGGLCSAHRCLECPVGAGVMRHPSN